jgi:hypothetical protein
VSDSSSSGIGFTGALFITFLVLKLTGIINWSWWWISAPLWIPVVAFLAIVLFIITPVALYREFKKK